jgi:hypothetical protein
MICKYCRASADLRRFISDSRITYEARQMAKSLTSHFDNACPRGTWCDNQQRTQEVASSHLLKDLEYKVADESDSGN